MPKGKKVCPNCNKEHGARKRQCECGHVFGGSKQAKASPAQVKQSKHPLGMKYIPTPGLWVFDIDKGMPAIHAPEPLPKGPLTNQEIYDQCAYNGFGDTLFEYIPSRRIADPQLRKRWKKAYDAMREAWRYLTDETTQHTTTTGNASGDADSDADDQESGTA